MSPVKMARSAINAVYESKALQWDIGTQFVLVKMDGCVIYTPCSHIKADKQTVFRDKLQQIYEISKNKS